MPKTRVAQERALKGSSKAVTRIEGRGQPKIGIGEFMSVAERFGLSRTALKQIRTVLEKEDWGEGPFLGNYYSGLKETKGAAFQRIARGIFKVKYALAVSSGTAALHAAFAAAGVGPGREVICPAIGFIATAGAVVMLKGVPVFCDVDESFHMDPEKLEALITPRTVAIAPTHVRGGVCDMAVIMRIARKYKLTVVEDCAQSCGATFRGKHVGTFGSLGCFSISSYKIVGGGEGGLVITNHRRLWERANQLAESGGLWRPDRFAPPRYEGELFCGTNYRMPELEAAIDVVQMRRMPGTVRRSNAVLRRVLGKLKRFKEITPRKMHDPDGELGYCLLFYPETAGLAVKLVAAMRAEGINCGTWGKSAPPDWHYYARMYPVIGRHGVTGPECAFTCPRYLEAGGRVNYSVGTCPVADDLFSKAVSVNLNQWYTARDCENIARGINKALCAHCTEDPEQKPWI